jgi:hypothetical protein
MLHKNLNLIGRQFRAFDWREEERNRAEYSRPSAPEYQLDRVRYKLLENSFVPLKKSKGNTATNAFLVQVSLFFAVSFLMIKPLLAQDDYTKT